MGLPPPEQRARTSHHDHASRRARIPTARRSPDPRTSTSWRGRRRTSLRYPAATLDQEQGEADASRAAGRCARRSFPAADWTFNADGTAISLLPPAPRSSANDIYEFSLYGEGSDRQRRRLRRGARLQRLPAVRDKATMPARPNPLAGDVTRIYTEVRVAARPHAERLPQSRLQSGRERQDRLRRHAAVDRGRRRHQHELPLLAAGTHPAQPAGSALRRGPVPVRQPDDHRSDHGQDGGPLRCVHASRTPARWRWRSIRRTSTG